ncbi:hypothetical protein DMH26_14385 [Streptomyces sp. WAC 05379]|uniref:hypothetical protein n=1 Tax=Streptomyces sp. WAC 05379 TaxID=2203207 RepID=UPI000F73C316|nr:hypothetical protein [Streptomyces sp. WAC 05379]RSO02329.1 hypothetical protein DMH26_14385 [Streptomyces sp. WAC 05379]
METALDGLVTVFPDSVFTSDPLEVRARTLVRVKDADDYDHGFTVTLLDSRGNGMASVMTDGASIMLRLAVVKRSQRTVRLVIENHSEDPHTYVLDVLPDPTPI